MVVLEYQVAKIVLQILRKGRRFIFEVAFNDHSSQKEDTGAKGFFFRGNVLHMNLCGIVKKTRDQRQTLFRLQ